MTNKYTYKGWQRVLLIILPYILIVGVLQLISYKIAGVDIQNVHESIKTYQEFTITLFTFIGTLLTVWLFVKRIDKESLISIGLHLKGKGRDIFYGLVLGFMPLGLGFVILCCSREISIIGIQFKSGEFLLCLLLFILVAFTEELLMRGYVLNNLMKSMNKFLALTISSIIFSVLHFGNPNYSGIACIDLFSAGIVLGMAYIYTKNLWFSIALHFSWNFFEGTIFGFNVSGQSFYSLIEQYRQNDNFINGGKFGFEGSIFSIAFQFICIFIIWKIYSKEMKTKTIQLID